MSDPVIIRANERRKAVAGVLAQLGTALLAAAFVKVYIKAAFDLETLFWIVGAVSLLWIGWLILGLLQSEDVCS